MVNIGEYSKREIPLSLTCEVHEDLEEGAGWYVFLPNDEFPSLVNNMNLHEIITKYIPKRCAEIAAIRMKQKTRDIGDRITVTASLCCEIRLHLDINLPTNYPLEELENKKV